MIKALYDFMVYHHPTKFGGHIHCGGVDITVLVCQVISEDHMMKGSCDFISKDPSRSVKFGGHRYSGSGDIIIFVCHVTLQDHVIKVLCDFMVRSLSR